MLFKRAKEKGVTFEESLGDDWSKDLDVVEVPLGNRPLFYLGIAVLLSGVILASQIFYLNVYRGAFYKSRAEVNVSQYQKEPAPRGLIYDRNGMVLAENKAVFMAVLDTKELLGRQELLGDTLQSAKNILGISADEILQSIKENISEGLVAPMVLAEDLTQSQLVQLKGLNLPTITIQSGFERQYAKGPMFSSVVGYVGRIDSQDLAENPELSGENFIGKAGIEAFYDEGIRGRAGVTVKLRNSKGQILSEEEKSKPQMGTSLHLALDGEFQEYFYSRLKSGLAALGRNVGLGLAINPENGEVLALINLPGFDNNLLSSAGHSDEKTKLLNSEDKPLFNRIVSGFYNPGSTIKPLIGVAALKEGVVDPKKQIFSPGYLDVPNPYDPENPSRYLDWRYQGNVDLASAIAQSSNVYFYTVGGGAGDVIGLGINRLREWWEEFGLGKPTGIDLPGEAAGFLPSVDWKEKKTGSPWLLGDTYNVSIGQGDLLLTPVQLLDYIAAIASGGKIYKPVINLDEPHPEVLADISALLPQIREVQKGMVEAVTAPLGTAHTLSDLGFSLAAKTGSAQIKNNEQVNALFVGYAPAEKPKIAVLILVENALEGSLNAVPIAKDVLNWYYWNRINRI
jgi:penicillin-binding protein 2